jgi:hypothetical protein
LQLDALAIQVDGLDLEINTVGNQLKIHEKTSNEIGFCHIGSGPDGCDERGSEGIVREAQQQARLADTTVTDQQQLDLNKRER